jgi:diguanylate cyclase (GGDEF)-like protein
MQADMRDLEETVDRLLADPASQGLPLHQALAALMERHRHLLRQLERITHIADRYQDAERERGLSYCQRYERQLRQLERLLRISDRYQQIMRNLHEELRQQSTHDALTGLYNRRFMHKRLLEEAAKLDRHPDQPFAVVLADIDHFKSINDTLGHDMGDTVLTEVSRRFLSHLRQYDVCARWGGEEFLLLLPSTTAEQAFRVCEHLRHVMADTLYHTPEGQPFALSMSFGYSACHVAADLNRALQMADRGLYDAKDAGRNCVRPALPASIPCHS